MQYFQLHLDVKKRIDNFRNDQSRREQSELKRNLDKQENLPKVINMFAGDRIIYQWSCDDI